MQISEFSQHFFCCKTDQKSSDSDPYLSITLNQVLHVPFDGVQMFLDVAEMLHGLVCPHSGWITLILDRANLSQRLVKGASAEGQRHHAYWLDINIKEASKGLK